jgi:hypothetical protein
MPNRSLPEQTVIPFFYRPSMALDLEIIYDRLYSYCRDENFAGYDPFDGLNSSLFQITPLKYFASARLAWLQMVKRSPVNLRPGLGVPKGVNPKGLALFSLAETARFRASRDEEHAKNVHSLLAQLLEKKIVGKRKDGLPTAAFGYNFDWQSRVFFAPEGTPAIVPTAFASQAFVEAYHAFDDEKYLAAASEICSFILSDLNRPIETDDEICFSYTPVDKSIIFNASLLAGESLARVGAITKNNEYLKIAARAARFAVRRQRSDGSWGYGSKEMQAWVDNFHTAYVLLSLHRISATILDLKSEISDAIQRGVNYWLDNFFLADGTPKYYDKSVYPVDIHSAAVAISVLCELSVLDDRMLPMATKTAQWTIDNMLDAQGYFYYQERKKRIVKTPFMRWGQAWMAYALARLIGKQDLL